jgi:5-methyltetrahydrofolate--homocysteine methyltransferase
LALYPGKALINSISADPKSLDGIFPIAQEYNAAVVALCMDERGIPSEAKSRLELAYKILEQAKSAAIKTEDVIFDPLAMAVGAQADAGQITLDAVRLIRKKIGANQTLGLSNISFGLPERDRITQTFLAMAIYSGVNCPVVDVARVRQMVLSSDFALGKDEYGRRYLSDYRRRVKA